MGARNVDEETIRRWISEAIADNPGGSSPLVYVALLTQSGTSTPILQVVANTFEQLPIPERSGEGVYLLTSTNGQFTIGKTLVNNNVDSFMQGMYQNVPLDYAAKIKPTDANTIAILLYKTSDGTLTDLSAIDGGTLLIKIETYQ